MACCMAVYPFDSSTYGRARPTVLRLKRGLHALGSAARSARNPRTTRAACRHRRAGLDAAGRPVRNGRRVRPHGGAARPRARADRDSRRGAPHRDSRRARRGPGPPHPVRAVPPRGARARPLLARLLAARDHRRRRASPPTSRTASSRSRSPSRAIAARGGSTSAEAPSMFRRLTLSVVLLVAGFVGGIVVTGWVRAADAGSTRRRPQSDRSPTAADPGRRQSPPHRPRSSRPPGAAGAVCRRRPRLHARRGSGGERRGEHLVAAGRAHAQLAVRQRSVLPLLLRRRRAVRLARSAIAEPRLGRHHLAGRLRHHQQPRRRRERPRDHDRAARQAGDQGQGHRHRPGDRHRAAEDSGDGTAGDRRGAIRAS